MNMKGISSARSSVRTTALVIAVLCLTIGTISGFLGWRLRRAPTMAAVVQTSLERKAVRERLSTLIADELVRVAPNLDVDHAELVNITGGIISSNAFRAFLEFAVEAIQHEIATGQPPPGIKRADELYATVSENQKLQNDRQALTAKPTRNARKPCERSKRFTFALIRA